MSTCVWAENGAAAVTALLLALHFVAQFLTSLRLPLLTNKVNYQRQHTERVGDRG